MKTISAEDNNVSCGTMNLAFSAGVLVYSYGNGERRFLFLEREEGWLDLPKGHIEKGEGSKEAAVRETFEETGLKVDIDPYFRDVRSWWFADKGEKIKKTATMFIGKPVGSEEVRISHEHMGYEWLVKTYSISFASCHAK